MRSSARRRKQRPDESLLRLRVLCAVSACLLSATACSSPEEEAFDMAVEDARSQAQDVQRALMPIMAGARSAASVERSFATGPSVFDSQVKGSTLFLDVVVVGTGSGGGGVGSLSRGVRACVRFVGQVRSDTVAMSDIECPQQQPFGLPAYDKTVLLWG